MSDFRTTVRLDKETADALAKRATRRKRTRNSVIVDYLVDGLRADGYLTSENVPADEVVK